MKRDTARRLIAGGNYRGGERAGRPLIRSLVIENTLTPLKN